MPFCQLSGLFQKMSSPLPVHLLFARAAELANITATRIAIVSLARFITLSFSLGVRDTVSPDMAQIALSGIRHPIAGSVLPHAAMAIIPQKGAPFQHIWPSRSHYLLLLSGSNPCRRPEKVVRIGQLKPFLAKLTVD